MWRGKYLRYVKSYKASNCPGHLALVGMILPVDHPFWQYFPRDYGCECSYEFVWDANEMTEPPADGERLPDGGWRFVRNGQLIVAPPNKSGYDFNAAEILQHCQSDPYGNRNSDEIRRMTLSLAFDDCERYAQWATLAGLEPEEYHS